MRRLRLVFLSTGNFLHIPPYLHFFRDRGHEVHWAALTPPMDVAGIQVHDISRAAAPQGRRAAKWRYLLSLYSLRKLLRRLRPDILHGHYATSAGVLCLLSGFRPYVLSARGSDVLGSMRSRPWRFILREAFRRAGIAHAVSSELSEVIRSLGVPSDRLLVVTQGVELQRLPFRPQAPDSSVLELVCTRHLRDIYDPLTIVRACSVLKDRGIRFRLTFAAGGPLMEELQRTVAAAGLANHVLFLGGYQQDRIAETLSQSSIYVSASLWDGTSVSLLEAMACGVFPVVSRIESNSAWVQDGRDALTFEPGNARELADCIVRAADDRLLCDEAVRRNRATVERRADRERNMLLLERCYYSLLDGIPPANAVLQMDGLEPESEARHTCPGNAAQTD